jgi:hypothetical protein
VHIVLEGTTRDEVKLVAIGYRYSQKTILFFALTENAGRTDAGDPYEMKYTDTYGNVCNRSVDHPDVISKFFQSSILLTPTINFDRICCIRKISGGQGMHIFGSRQHF